MNRKHLSLAAIAAASTAVASTAAVYTEGFEGESVVGGWTGGQRQSILFEGEGSGHFLRTDQDAAYPAIHSIQDDCIFHGDYRVKGVERLGLILRTAYVDTTTDTLPLTLMLVHDNDTQDPDDDSVAYFVGPPTPAVGEGWVWYQFDVPAEESQLPAGWSVASAGDPEGPVTHTWDEIVQHVSFIQYQYGDPGIDPGPPSRWIVDADELEIIFQPTVTGDVDGNGRVDVVDYTILNQEWGPCEDGCLSDLDHDGQVGATDLSILIQHWTN